jgi:hypothetical protein
MPVKRQVPMMVWPSQFARTQHREQSIGRKPTFTLNGAQHTNVTIATR